MDEDDFFDAEEAGEAGEGAACRLPLGAPAARLPHIAMRSDRTWPTGHALSAFWPDHRAPRTGAEFAEECDDPYALHR